MNTMYIIIAFLGLWVVPFIIFLTFNSRREKKAHSFINENSDRDVVHLFCSHIRIDGQDISVYKPLTGEYLEKVVALEPGKHTIEGV